MNNINFRHDILPLKNQLYRLALRITLDSAEAEDIVQETMIKIWNRRDTWDKIDNIEAFCLTICRNLALDSIRKRENQNKSLDATQADHPDNNLSPAQRLVEHDVLSIVKKIMDSLPEKQRSCIQLRDFEGKPYKDIAKVLNITEEQVKINIFRGRQTIKQRFQEVNNFGVNPDPA